MRKSLRHPPLLAFLALGAGLSGALVLLALLDAAILRPIPGVSEPSRLLRVRSTSLSYSSLGDFENAVAQAGSPIQGIAGFGHRLFSFSSGSGADERRTGVVVAGDYFGVLGLRPVVGRLLRRDDDRAGAPLAIVLSHSFWLDRFGGATDIVGREVRLNGATFSVVGVTDRAFRGLVRDRRPDFFVTAHAWFENAPSTFGGLSIESRGWDWLNAVLRLAPGATSSAAIARLEAEAARQVQLYPNAVDSNFAEIDLAPATLQAAGLQSESAARTASAAILTLVALLVVLSISSAAHLFLARGEARRQELATRLALGADRSRLIGLLLLEPIGCALAAAVAAIGVAVWTLKAIGSQTLPGGTPVGDLGLAIDAPLAVAGTLLAVLAGAAAGFLPARRLFREDLGRSLGSVRTISHGSAKLRRALTVAQVAISLLLVAGTALVSRALLRATAIDTGYEGDGIGFVTLDAGLARLDADHAAASYEAALAAVAALPEVESASLILALPLDPGTDVESFTVSGYAPAEGEQMGAEINLVGPNALSLLGIDIVAGRELDASDRFGRDAVAVISRRFAERYFQGRDPVGATVEMSTRPVRVIGVAEDVRAHGPGETQPPAIYFPLLQSRDPASLWPITVVYRSRQDPDRLLVRVKDAIAAVAPGVPVFPVGSFDNLLAAAVAPQRFGSALLGAFSLVATLLAAVGLFGLVAHAAAARTRELGLRAALGARPARLVQLLVGAAFLPVALGGALGLVAAFALAFAARGLMVGLESFDSGALALAALVLLATTGFAAMVPAWRGARLDPVAALRSE